MVAIATCNYPATQLDCNGHSTVLDGVAYLPELPESRDTCILEAGEEEGICMAMHTDVRTSMGFLNVGL